MKNKVLFTIIVCALVIAAIAIGGIYLVKRQNVAEEQISAFKIETPFVDLEYPSRWQDKVKAQWIGNESAGKVVFSAKLDDKEEKELFVISFNEEAQTEVGILKTKDGNVDVGLSFAEPIFDEGWNEEEKDTIYAMQEEINFTMKQLLENKTFKER